MPGCFCCWARSARPTTLRMSAAARAQLSACRSPGPCDVASAAPLRWHRLAQRAPPARPARRAVAGASPAPTPHRSRAPAFQGWRGRCETAHLPRPAARADRQRRSIRLSLRLARSRCAGTAAAAMPPARAQRDQPGNPHTPARQRARPARRRSKPSQGSMTRLATRTAQRVSSARATSAGCPVLSSATRARSNSAAATRSLPSR